MKAAVRGAAADAPAPPRDVLADRVLGVETPEHVRIEYPLAGLGTRFWALLIDAILMVIVMAAGPLLGLLVVNLFDVRPALSLMGGLALLWCCLIWWGWFFWFETFRDGQTPGKRRLGIRVVMEDGTPLTARAAAVRNLVRLIDIQPIPSCLVGGFFMLVTAKSRRLGDLAAGTVVVRELPIEFPDLDDLPASKGPPRLSDAEYALLETFADQEAQFEPAARKRLAWSLWHRFESVAGAPLDAGDPVAAVLALYVEESGRRHAARLHMSTGTPAATALLRSKRKRWEQFRLEVARLRRGGLKRLDAVQIGEFAARHRELSADLARARTYGASVGTLYALERLAGAAHNLFYRPGGRTLRLAAAFVTHGFPELVRRLWLPIACSAVLLYAPAILVFVLATHDPDVERMLADPEMIRRALKALDPGTNYRDTWSMVWGSEFLSSLIIANNLQVTFMLFASGLFAGLGALALLVYNGIQFGTALAIFSNRGVLENIVNFVLPHGFLELSAIAIAGGAGLWMGSAFVLPGRERRLDAFARRAKESVALMAGVAAMLLVAGAIEGCISPARTTLTLKLLIGASIAAATLAWLLLAGRRVRTR